MYPVSNDYISAVSATSVQCEWYGTITLTDETVIDFNKSNIEQGSSRLTRQISSGDTLELGTAYSNELVLGLRGTYDNYSFYNAVISLYFRLFLDEDRTIYEDVACGSFIVEDASRTKSVATLTAYDYMHKFSTKIRTKIPDQTVFSAIDYICTQCGVERGNTLAEIEVMPNGTLTIPCTAINVNDTFQTALGYIADFICAYAYIGTDGKLYFTQYNNTAVRVVGGGYRYDSSYIDYIGRYTTLVITNNDGDEVSYQSSETYADATLLTLTIGNNPLINNHSDATTICQNIIDRLATLIYAPCTISSIQDPSLLPGDKITLSGGTLTQDIPTMITAQTITLFGKTEIVSSGGNYVMQEVETILEQVVNTVPQQITDLQTQNVAVQADIQTLYGSVVSDYILPYGVNLNEVTDTDQSGLEQTLLAFRFDSSIDGNTLAFYSQINFNVHTFTKLVNGDTVYQDAVIKVRYYYDGTLCATQVHYRGDGWQIMMLNYLIPNISDDTHTFTVTLEVQGASLYSMGVISAYLYGAKQVDANNPVYLALPDDLNEWTAGGNHAPISLEYADGVNALVYNMKAAQGNSMFENYYIEGVPEGKTYRLTAQVRKYYTTANYGEVGGYFYIYSYDGYSQTQIARSNGLPAGAVSEDWTDIEVEFEVPEGSEGITFQLSWLASGTNWGTGSEAGYYIKDILCEEVSE